MIDFIHASYHRLIKSTTFTTHRYLYTKFNINDRLTGIIGPRGVGKTTLMLQYIKQHLYPNHSTIYFSADNIYFSTNTILEFVNTCYLNEGIKFFFIDEIHKYSNWSQELKNIYDSFPDVKVIFSGSSSMDLIKGSSDLSRRATLFYLHGLSFREYLNFTSNTQLTEISWQDILEHHVELSSSISSIPKILGHFKDYIRNGYYPFLFDNTFLYYEKIVRVIDKTIFEDIANYYQLKTENLHYFRSILNYLATIPPGSINTHSIAKHLTIDDKTVFHYLTILSETGLVRFIPAYAKGKQVLSKPQKIFLNNTTLHCALDKYLGTDNEIGNKRELFFTQSVMNANLDIFTNDYADFQVGHHLFEVGGKNKTIQHVNKTNLPIFLVKDDILIGNKNTIPLFFFGFLY